MVAGNWRSGLKCEYCRYRANNVIFSLFFRCCRVPYFFVIETCGLIGSKGRGGERRAKTLACLVGRKIRRKRKLKNRCVCLKVKGEEGKKT